MARMVRCARPRLPLLADAALSLIALIAVPRLLVDEKPALSNLFVLVW